MLPLIGRDSEEDSTSELLCKTFQFKDRGAPDMINIFEWNELISGFAITYPTFVKETIVKAGLASDQRLSVKFEQGQVLAGFFGAYNEELESITQLGVIMQDTECTLRSI